MAVAIVGWILLVQIGAVFSADVSESRNGMEFIYHEQHSLLLTMRNDSCYFTTIPDQQKRLMTDEDSRNATEDKITDIIISDNTTFLFNTTLDDMRDEYADLLANFRCFGKNIFSLDLFPPEKVTCDFESLTKPHCAFSPHPGANFTWTQGTGPTPSAGTGPAADHTSGTGHYMYIESSEPRLPGDMARLVSQVFYNPDGSLHCVRFFYHMYGSSTGSLHVYTVSDQSSAHLPPPVWSKSGDQGDQWKEAELDISRSGKFKVIFEGVVGPGFYGDIAIDDVSVSRGPCGPPIKCDFESSSDPWCGMEQDPSAVFNWTLHSGPTPSEGTGPATDHTLGPNGAVPGSYIYIESSEPRQPGDTARVVKQIAASANNSERCLGFFYHMHGAGIGTLNVYAKTGNSLSQLPPPIWTESGNQGDTWKGVNVTIPIATDFQLVFEGLVGNSNTYFVGDTAVDDITISDGACPNDVVTTTVRPVTTTTQTTLSTTTTTPAPYRETTQTPQGTTPPPAPTSSQPTHTSTPAHTISPCEVDNAAIFKCCFESKEAGGWCGFIQGTHDNFHRFDWSRGRSHTATPNTGPHSDHSLGDRTGHFVYIDATNHVHNALAALITPHFYAGDNYEGSHYCLKFYYHMYGSDIGSLHVHVVHNPDPYNNQVGNPVWSRDGDQGDQWREATVEFPTYGTFRIDFEGIVGSGPYGDIAIDDVFLYRGTCSSQPGTPVSQSPVTTTFFHATNTHPTPHALASPAVRLVDGASPTSGRLEVYHQGQWGTVCKMQFDYDNDPHLGQVVCRMLGLTGGEAGVLMWADTADGTGRVAMHDVLCFGHETSLWDCQYQEDIDPHCAGHDVDLGIYCGNPCHYNGHTYPDGQSFQDPGCSVNCKCVDGQVHL